MNPNDKLISIIFHPCINCQQMRTILANLPNPSATLKIRRFRKFDVMVQLVGKLDISEAINWLRSQKFLIVEAEEIKELSEEDKFCDSLDASREKVQFTN